MLKDPQAAADKSLARQSVTLENLGWVRGRRSGLTHDFPRSAAI
jgi:hypothetical protein